MAMEFSDDGRVFVAEKSGLIKMFDGLGDASASIFADLRTNVYNQHDRGLMAPDHGYPSYLDLTLTARDSDGNSTSDTVRIHPRTVDLAFDTNPGGLELTVGEATDRAPFSRTVIIGSANSISAPNPQDPGDFWFVAWNIGGPRAQEVTAPCQTGTYLASYLTCTVGGAKVADCGGPTPSAPRNVQVAIKSGKFTVSWTPPYWPGVDGLVKYRVVVDGGKTYVVDPADTSQRVAGLGNRSGVVTVQAFSSAGGGPIVTKTLR